jgi:hypothetical protein
MTGRVDPLCGQQADDAKDAERDAAEWEALDWEPCSECDGEGVAGHDCGEDSCPCLNPEDNMKCQTCNGEGGWKTSE